MPNISQGHQDSLWL